jgi:hypothetical protein
VARERKSRDAVSSYGKKFKPQIILSAVRLLAGNRVGARRSRDIRILFQRRHGDEESAKTSGKGQECPNHAALWRKGRVRSPLSGAHINFVISNAINSSQLSNMPDKTRFGMFAKRALISFACSLAVTYVCDFMYFRMRRIHLQPSNPIETFTSPRLYAIAVKGGKVDYELDGQNPEQTWVCAHSLFPHAGYTPCWYIKPKSRQPIPM